MKDAWVDTIKTETRIGKCGRMQVTLERFNSNLETIRFSTEVRDPFTQGNILKSDSRDLAMAILAWLDSEPGGEGK